MALETEQAPEAIAPMNFETPMRTFLLVFVIAVVAWLAFFAGLFHAVSRLTHGPRRECEGFVVEPISIEENWRYSPRATQQPEQGRYIDRRLLLAPGDKQFLQMQHKQRIRNVATERSGVVGIDLVPGAPTSILLTGRNKGWTTIALTDTRGHTEEVIVSVGQVNY